MDNYALVIDISSDEENNRYSTPIKTLPINMVGRLDLSNTSTEVPPGSERELNGSIVNLNLTNVSASTFESGPSPRNFGIDIIPERTAPSEEGEIFVTEAYTGNESESSFFEEPDSPRGMPPLQAAPILRDVTNLSPTQYEPPEKAGKSDDLNEPSAAETEETWGLDLNGTTEFYSLAGRGSWFSSTKIHQRKQPVTIVKEIAHCHGLPIFVREGPCRDPLPVAISTAVQESRLLQEELDTVTISFTEPNFD